MPGRRAPPDCIGRPTPSCANGDRSPGRGPARPHDAPARPPPPLTLAQRAVLAHEQLVVRPLFVREFEKHLFPLRVLEALAVAFEELVRAALAPDADEKRLLIVHAFGQLFRAGGEEPA